MSGLYCANYPDNWLTETIQNQYYNGVIIGKKIIDKTIVPVHIYSLFPIQPYPTGTGFSWGRSPYEHKGPRVKSSS